MTARTKAPRHLVGLANAVMVCLDSEEQNMVPAMALNAERVLDEMWNGWARPVATAQAFDDFLGRWRINDPNGTWGTAVEVDGVIRYQDLDGNDPEDFPPAGKSQAGMVTYDFSGWAWIRI